MARNNRYFAFCFLFLLAGTSSAVSAVETPSAAALVDMMLANPPKAYQGQMMVSYWSDNGSKAEDVKIYFSPPNNYRFEFLAPNGTVDRVVMSNGSHEQVQLMKNNQVSESYTTETRPSLIGREEEKNLLKTNYNAVIKDSEKVLGRQTWTVELTPIVPGKPHQLMRIDRTTGVILEIKRFMPEGKTGSLTRFIQFEPAANLSGDLFLPNTGAIQTSSRKDGIEYTPEQLTAGSNNGLPQKLHGGFSLTGGDQFEVSGKLVRQLRYTDGLLPVSIFQTPLPVKAPAEGKQIIQWSRPIEMGTTNAGNVFQWQRDKQFYTLIGDVQQDLLQQIAGTLH